MQTLEKWQETTEGLYNPYYIEPGFWCTSMTITMQGTLKAQDFLKQTNKTTNLWTSIFHAK